MEIVAGRQIKPSWQNGMVGFQSGWQKQFHLQEKTEKIQRRSGGSLKRHNWDEGQDF
jgi:hypothetical protein